jgi:hypothetical protein
MSLLADELNTALGELESDSGSPVATFSANQYACRASTLSRGTTLEIGGYTAEIMMTLRFRQKVFAGVSTLPSAGKTISYGGVTYRVLSWAATPGGAEYVAHLGNVNT